MLTDYQKGSRNPKPALAGDAEGCLPMDSKQHAELTLLVTNMAAELHTMKGTLAANTSFMREFFTRMDSMQEKIEKSDERIAAVVIASEKVLTGFPSADLDGHRRYHEAAIEWRELRNKIVREALVKAGQAGLFGGIVILVTMGWKAFKLSILQ